MYSSVTKSPKWGPIFPAKAFFVLLMGRVVLVFVELYSCCTRVASCCVVLYLCCVMCVCVFIFFHREGFFRLQDIQDILEGTDQRSCVVNIS